MILPNQTGTVAEWIFDDGLVNHLNWPSLQGTLEVCQTMTSILMAHRLLVPNKVCLSQWMKAGERRVAESERVEKPEIFVSVDPANYLAEIFTTCRSIIEGESVYPLRVEISGSGVIVGAAGDSVLDDVVWLRAITLDTFYVTVGTQSDAWLPFSLNGEAQPDIYTLNAGRLEQALQEIQRQSGFELQEGVESDYSIITGFRLDNRRYADGSLEVVDD